MQENKKTMYLSPIYWKSGVIKRVCMSPKVAETRASMRLIDDGTTLARQILQLLNTEVSTRAFTDSKPLLESIGI